MLGPGATSYQPRKGEGGGGVGQGVEGGQEGARYEEEESQKEWAHHHQAGGARLACRSYKHALC